jgi:hypothetical protein
MSSASHNFVACLAAASLLAGCLQPPTERKLSAEISYTEARAPCLDRNPLRNLYFGDLHFHTLFSWDAYGYQLEVTPEQSYRFAKGGAVFLPPLESPREVRLGRPLDFAAATDHAEFLGETLLCRTPGSSAYDTGACAKLREGGTSAVAAWGMQLIGPEGNERLQEVCGGSGEACTDAAGDAWEAIQQAAEEAYDRTDQCTFVSFVGYEYTATPLATNMHRNVIFRTKSVPGLPVSYYEEPTPWGLWRALEEQCLDAGAGCDVAVIPHNANWSNGNLFYPDFSQGPPEEAAALRARLEPLMEIYQHKGEMECENGVTGATREDDPFCAFEKIRFPPIPDCGKAKGWGGVNEQGCVSRYDFLRGILLQGMLEQPQLGLNPFRIGVIGSTDTHNGTPGNTWERGWPGHVGNSDNTPEERLGPGNVTHRGLINNPGGLAAVWAVERSRDAIFEAFRRREVYSTSGTRIAVRLFGGWGLAEDTCEREDLVEQGYLRGVPMGGVLRREEIGADAPMFVVEARHDPGTADRPGAPLQQVQIVKGWIDEQGQARERVYFVAGDQQGRATVDPKTCKTGGPGYQTLCGVWRDPSFNPEERAFYYARVLENPTCRWSTWECIALPEGNRPDGCTDPRIQPVIQERAWTSAIWYEP